MIILSQTNKRKRGSCVLKLTSKQTDSVLKLNEEEKKKRNTVLKIGQCQCARDDRTRVPNTILIPASLVNEHPESSGRLETWPWPINRAPGFLDVATNLKMPGGVERK